MEKLKFKCKPDETIKYIYELFVLNKNFNLNKKRNAFLCNGESLYTKENYDKTLNQFLRNNNERTVNILVYDLGDSDDEDEDILNKKCNICCFFLMVRKSK